MLCTAWRCTGGSGPVSWLACSSMILTAGAIPPRSQEGTAPWSMALARCTVCRAKRGPSDAGRRVWRGLEDKSMARRFGEVSNACNEDVVIETKLHPR